MSDEPIRPPRSWAELVRGIGWTPIVRVPVWLGRRRRTVLLKLEGHNPFGSIKDRTAYSLIRSLEIDQGGTDELTVVESTSGNLGVALAGMCALRGHRFHAVVDPKVSPENLALMRRLGARIEVVSAPDQAGNFLCARIDRARQICAAEPQACWTNQYGRRANPLIHYLQTGPEIWRQAGPDLDAVFIAISTGGTLAGVTASLRAATPVTTVVGVDVQGSAALGGAHGPRQLTGIGSSRRSAFVRPHEVDRLRWVDDAEAIAVCRLLADCGIRVGGSSGATVAACLRHLQDRPLMRHVLCLSADHGAKYRTTVYDDEWVRARGIDLDAALSRIESRGIRFGRPDVIPQPRLER